MAAVMTDDIKKKGYRRIDFEAPRDADITDRNSSGRILVLIVSLGLIMGLPFLLLSTWLGWIFGSNVAAFIGKLIGILVGGFIASRTLSKYFLIFNPEWTAYVTQNIGKEMVAYGPSWHVSYPWESRDKSGNYSLSVITRSFETVISANGSAVQIEGEYEYMISLPLLKKAIGVDETTIQAGLIGFIKSRLTSICCAQTSDWVRKGIDEINKELADEFMRAEGDEIHPGNFEKALGFKTVSVLVNRITLPPEVQKARNAVAEATQMHEIVAEMYGLKVDDLRRRLNLNPEDHQYISKNEYDKMLNRAMTMSDNAKMSVSVIEGEAGAIGAKFVADVAGQNHK